MVMTMVDKSIYDLYGHLLVSANSVRGNAYAKYSGFRVGAALMADDGTVHTGVNVENASYGCGVCAEAGAISNMIGSRGVRGIVAIKAAPTLKPEYLAYALPRTEFADTRR